MKYVQLLETPHRFDEPEPLGNKFAYPTHMNIAKRFQKFIHNMWMRVDNHTTSNPTHFHICDYDYTVDSTDTKLVSAMKLWQEYDKIHPLNIYILQDPELALDYARDVIQGRWPEAEPVIMTNPRLAAQYAIDVIEDEWPEAEPQIMKDPVWTYRYAVSVRKSRWKAAEHIFKHDKACWVAYWKHLASIPPKNGYVPPSLERTR